VVKTKQLHLCT